MALNFAEKVPFNIIADMLKVIVVALVGIWVTPFYLRSLGDSAYGLISLAFTITTYVVFVAGAINGACSRYNIVAIRQNKDISKTMSTSFFGITKVCLILLPIVLIIVIATPYIFNIGKVPPIEVQIMFSTIIISAFITNIISPYRSVFGSLNSDYYGNLIDCCNSILQVIFTVFLFINIIPSVMNYGIAFLSSSIISAILVYYFSRREYCNYEIKLSYYDKELFKEIGSLAKWNVISSIGSILFIETSIIIVNIFLGEAKGGLFGLIATIVSMVTMATMTVTHSFGPFTLRYYAENNIEMIRKILSSGLKFVSLVVAMPLAYIMVFSPQIMTAWVGPEYAHLSEYLFVIAIAFVIYCTVFSLYSVPSAFLAVNKSSVIAIVCGSINVVLAIFFCLTTDWGLFGVVVAYSLSIVLYALSYAILCEKLIKTKRFHFIKLFLYGVCSLIICYALLSIIGQLNIVSGNWFSVITSFLIMFAIYMVIVVLLLPKNDKDMIEGILSGKFRSMFHNVFNK